jgi:hypothetical protein
MKSLAILATIAFAFASGSAAISEPQVSVITPGNPSCGKWTSERQLGSVKFAQYESWVWGYVSGWAGRALAPDDPLEKTDAAGITGWISNYCNANPLDKVTHAAHELIQELQTRYGGN